MCYGGTWMITPSLLNWYQLDPMAKEWNANRWTNVNIESNRQLVTMKVNGRAMGRHSSV